MPARRASCAVNGLPSQREGSTHSVGGAQQVGDVVAPAEQQDGSRSARIRSASSSSSGPSPAIATSGAGQPAAALQRPTASNRTS